jgi:hypothetical protein
MYDCGQSQIGVVTKGHHDAGTYVYDIHLYTYIHTYIHACIHTYIQTYMQTRKGSRSLASTYPGPNTILRMSIHTLIYASIDVYANTTGISKPRINLSKSQHKSKSTQVVKQQELEQALATSPANLVLRHAGWSNVHWSHGRVRCTSEVSILTSEVCLLGMDYSFWYRSLSLTNDMHAYIVAIYRVVLRELGAKPR